MKLSSAKDLIILKKCSTEQKGRKLGIDSGWRRFTRYDLIRPDSQSEEPSRCQSSLNKPKTIKQLRDKLTEQIWCEEINTNSSPAAVRSFTCRVFKCYKRKSLNMSFQAPDPPVVVLTGGCSRLTRVWFRWDDEAPQEVSVAVSICYCNWRVYFTDRS